jgi:hypothetical protein
MGPSGNGLVGADERGGNPAESRAFRLSAAPVRFQKAVPGSKEKRRGEAPIGAPARVMGRPFPSAEGTGFAVRRAIGCGVPHQRLSALRPPRSGANPPRRPGAPSPGTMEHGSMETTMSGRPAARGVALFFNRTTCNQPVMPRESGASSIDGLAITGSPAGACHRAGQRPDPLAGDDGWRPKRPRAFWRNEPELPSQVCQGAKNQGASGASSSRAGAAVARKPQPIIGSAQILWMV